MKSVCVCVCVCVCNKNKNEKSAHERIQDATTAEQE